MQERHNYIANALELGSWKKDVTPLLTHWSYIILALSHWDAMVFLLWVSWKSDCKIARVHFNEFMVLKGFLYRLTPIFYHDIHLTSSPFSISFSLVSRPRPVTSWCLPRASLAVPSQCCPRCCCGSSPSCHSDHGTRAFHPTCLPWPSGHRPQQAGLSVSHGREGAVCSVRISNEAASRCGYDCDGIGTAGKGEYQLWVTEQSICITHWY